MKNKTMKLVALRNIYYDGDRKTGEEFDARQEHVQSLVITGAARLLTEEDSKAKRYNRRDMRAED